MRISPTPSKSKLCALLVECAPQEPTGYAINLLKAAALSNPSVASDWQIDCLTLRVKDFSEVDDERLRSRKHLSVVSEIVARNPSLVGFSVFVWNVSITTALTRMLKLARPEIRVIWGGKLVENDWRRLAESCSEIDCFCIGDGEAVFPAILESNSGSDNQVPGTVIRRNGSLIELLPTGSRQSAADCATKSLLDGID
ncbi:cobalamin B12-binding domain-containing protein [Bradyrhizobium barranii subsp. apii]|uniref:Cobalamin B12-binding domain-containing protein n=1 Tax=Bradyrhizobium barranii subsp. apii TaxID=2819348 RepID=A0A8T5VPF4_9BRAD|nr:cobalamin B12-binding domain-containing protein [Bradyrhizobium barranii]UPT89228.1 cobalamin B12-binding domain-containing protein [Bradyrhizobium barranii subsp. apii]